MIGHGATLVGSVAGTIGKLTNIDWSGISSVDVDNTDFDSANKIQEFSGGLIDSGEITGDLNYDATLTATILARVIANVNETWTLTLSDTKTLVCTGRLKSLGMGVPMGDRVTMPIAIKLSGEPVFS